MKKVRRFNIRNKYGSTLEFVKYVDSGECFVEEEINNTNTPISLSRKCSGITNGCLDSMIKHGLSKLLRDRPIKIVFSRWYEHMDPMTYISFGNYNMHISASYADDGFSVTFKTNYKNGIRTYENTYELTKEEKIKDLIEIFS